MKRLFGARKQEPQRQPPIMDLSYQVDPYHIPYHIPIQQPKDGGLMQPMPFQPPLQSTRSPPPIRPTYTLTSAPWHKHATSPDSNWAAVDNGNILSPTADLRSVPAQSPFESFNPPPPGASLSTSSIRRPLRAFGGANDFAAHDAIRQSLNGAPISAENLNPIFPQEVRGEEKHDKPKRSLFDWLGGEREKEKIARERTQPTNLGPDGQPWDLTRLMGFVIATVSEDWTLLMELCDQASTDSGAKEAAKALKSEIKYADPPAMLSAARLWAIMLRNTKHPFIQQTSSRRFLEAVEDAYNGPDTSPVVRDRLVTVIAGASFQFGDKYSSFRSLWKRIKSPNSPTEGVAFDPKDAMFSPPSRRLPKPGFPAQDPNYRASMMETIPAGESLASLQASMGQGIVPPPPQQQYRNSIQQIPMEAAPVQFDKDSIMKPRNQRHRSSKMGIVSPEEDMQRLFEECKIAKNNARLLIDALTYAKPEEVVVGGAEGLIRQFYNNCMRSQELISTQISWATTQSDRARYHFLANNPDAPTSESLTEEDLLAEILTADQVLVEAFSMYDELERVAVAEREEREVQERSRVERRLDRTQIQCYAEDGLFMTQPLGGAVAGSGSSRSSSPRPRQDHLLPAPQSAVWHPPAMTPQPRHQPNVLSSTSVPPLAAPHRPSPGRSRTPSLDGGASRSVDVASIRNGANTTPTDQLNTLGHGMGNLDLYVRRPRGVSLTYGAWVVDDDEDETPIRPSAKALGKRRAETPPEEVPFDPDDLFKDRVPTPPAPPEESLLNSDSESTDDERGIPHHKHHVVYAYDAAAESLKLWLAEVRGSTPRLGMPIDEPPSIRTNGSPSSASPPIAPAPEDLGYRKTQSLGDSSQTPSLRSLAASLDSPTSPHLHPHPTPTSPIMPNQELVNAPGINNMPAQATVIGREPKVGSSGGIPLPTALAENLGDQILFNTVEPFDTRGHFCDLFLGDHRTAGKVALKRLRHRGGSEGDIETLTRQCKREKDVWMRLRHDRILKCLGTFTRERHLYLVSPFMKNGSLFDWIRSKPHLGLERLRLIHELADALVYLHSSGIVHGDIKSNNVLLSDDMHVQLCDFGLTKLAESATTTTLKGAGTVRWQSPELWTDTPKSLKSDSYAFAMTIVEILTGKIPFATISSDYAVIMAVSMRGERPVPSPGVSPDGKCYANAWDVAARCWHGDIEQRISMEEAVELFAFCTERY